VWVEIPLLPSSSIAQEWNDAFDDVKSRVPALIARAQSWLVKANELPDDCPWKAGVLGQLKDLHIRLVMMNQDLTDTTNELPVRLRAPTDIFFPGADGYTLSGGWTAPYEFSLHLKVSTFNGPSRNKIIFHEPYHMTEWGGGDCGWARTCVPLGR
jgi:hypothetical protein